MRIGDEVLIKGTINEIRKDIVIIENEGGYFGTVPNEIVPSVNLQKPKTGWIPVSERLPNYREKVLVCYETEEGLEVDTSMFDKYGCRRGNAVAWMPLPKAYKKEGD